MCRNKAYQFIDDELFRGYVPADLPKIESAPLEWKGGKLEVWHWAQIMGFMRDSYEKFKAETVVFLFYNFKEHCWDSWAPPQETSGMAVEVDHDTEAFKEQRATWGPDWVLGGTVHHHCDMSAFASQADDDDEMTKNGFHVTVGNLKDEIASVDCRLTYNGYKYEANISEFVDNPLHLNGGLYGDFHKLQEKVYGALYNAGYPEFWIKNVEKKRMWGTHGYVKPTGNQVKKPTEEQKFAAQYFPETFVLP